MGMEGCLLKLGCAVDLTRTNTSIAIMNRLSD